MKTELFMTPIGNYNLPSDIKTDAVVNAMKAGKIFEPEVVAVAKRFAKKGCIILDLGANFGQMALLFSDMVGPAGRVYAFEAAGDVCEVLANNIAVNGKQNITVVNKAVWNVSGETVFYPEPDFKRFGSYGSYGIDPVAKNGRAIDTVTIDEVVKGPVCFMKVDIQGSDLFAMMGARDTIRKNRMPILFECEEQFQKEFGTSFDDYLKYIESIDYHIVDVISGINFLIVPKEMHFDFLPSWGFLKYLVQSLSGRAV